MKIPKIISKNNHEYIFMKQYPNFVLYRDWLTGTNECFTYHELGLIKPIDEKWTRRNFNPQKVKK